MLVGGFWALFKLRKSLIGGIKAGLDAYKKGGAGGEEIPRTERDMPMNIILILIGYSALFFSFIASVLYLLHERSLKRKDLNGIAGKLPALETIDNIGYRLLLIGFPFMTIGLIAGSVIAQVQYGASYFQDPKIILSLLMWSVYTVMLYTRWNSGWRGRRAALLSAFAFAAALSVWAANYFSGVHRFVSR